MNLKQAIEEVWPMLRDVIPTLPAYADATKEQLDLAHTCYGAGYMAAGGRASVPAAKH